MAERNFPKTFDLLNFYFQKPMFSEYMYGLESFLSIPRRESDISGICFISTYLWNDRNQLLETRSLKLFSLKNYERNGQADKLSLKLFSS